MRAANILALIAATLWFGVFLMGRGLVSGVVDQRVLGYPNDGQIGLYVVFPASIVMGLLALAWIINLFQRWTWPLTLASSVALLALLPFLALGSGGV